MGQTWRNMSAPFPRGERPTDRLLLTATRGDAWQGYVLSSPSADELARRLRADGWAVDIDMVPRDLPQGGSNDAAPWGRTRRSGPRLSGEMDMGNSTDLAVLSAAVEDQSATIDELGRAVAAGDVARRPELLAALARMEALAHELRERVAGGAI